MIVNNIIKNKIFRMAILCIIDMITVFFTGFLVLFIRFEFNLSFQFLNYFYIYLHIVKYYIALTVVVFAIFNLYKVMWSVASIREAIIIFFACLVSSVFYYIVSILKELYLPRSFYLLEFIFLYVVVVSGRFSYRLIRSLSNNLYIVNKHVMIVGAGEAGSILLKEIKTSKYTDAKVVCFIDDNPNKKGKNLNGVKIIGNRNDIIKVAEKYQIDEIYIALPSVNEKDKREIINIAAKTNCKVKVLPGIYQIMNGDVAISRLRDINIEDLLMREPININTEEIISFVENKTVLVTGAGGSIGSELARQIIMHNPKKLILLDIYENSIYDIQLELMKKYNSVEIVTLIASVRDEKRIDEIFENYNIDIVFHAAAHKHVPLMEFSPMEAIKNNCYGTLNVVNACDKYNAKKFILISTDKAVNPTNVMGASKRICEMIIQYKSKHSKTNFAAVRFGNVLGSNGSVVPLFKKQILEGGPVTVTDRNVTRYFMTIPEAVSLVLQAGAYAKGGEIFVLDMGKPVKIIDMAENLIRLSGYKPYEDIDIVITGLRPGEKLYEELMLSEEGLKKTNNDRIFIGHPIVFNEDEFMKELKDLMKLANENLEFGDEIKKEIKKIVKTYEL